MSETGEENLENMMVTFIPKKCPTCGKVCAVKRLGVWGYYCTDCMMWWGTYDPWPKVETSGAAEPAPEPAASEENTACS